LPPRLAGMTPCRITQNRSAVTPHSRTITTIVTHQGRSPRIERPMNAAPVSALSAIGSAILPKFVTMFQRRAMSPSNRSVTIATTKAAVANSRFSSDAPPSRSSSQTNSGTRTSRSTVSALATFQALGALSGPAAARGTGFVGGLVTRSG
jgi:hypothetical protein